ncbi:glucose-6-phosphatase 3-like [Hyalella azteca]|uniref:Glucose-6-phosphatase 3-like n=1 Tax=Hyalella azteca TaxID=294128 RepID=A0A8B7P5R2_HYAAZ|nr:glucose-6-phosphatase 3-like [Hyalella azteca]
MEAIKAAGTYFVSYIQKTWLVNYAYKLHQTTHYASPGFLLTIACPILFALQGAVVNKSGVTVDSGVAHAVLWTVLVGIRFNIIKQWSLGEDRPFWWVSESPHFTWQRIPDLRQFPVTCLTSPAAPLFSLLAAGAGIVIVNAAVKLIKSIEFKNARQRRWIVIGTWLSFGVFVGSVAEAEMLFLTNFPHQVAISLAIGLSIGYVATRRSFSRVASIKKILLVNLVIMALCYLAMWRGEAIATFNDYQKLVFKWCQRREWMQIDPSPLLDSFLYTG